MNPTHLQALRDCCHSDAAFQQMQEILQSQCQSHQAQHQALLRVITKIRESLDLPTTFKVAATEVRQLLNADRVGIFRFYPDSWYNEGEFVAEDVLPPYPSALAARVQDHCFGEQFAVHYQHGRIQAVDNIETADLKPCHIDVLSRFQIRANLVVPLLQGDHLWGLLCIHQCSAPRPWQPEDIEFVTLIAEHLGVALQQAELLTKTQQQTLELSAALNHLQQMQMQLIQNEKMSSLGQLMAGIAHEINNPVNFIYGNLNHAVDYAHDLLEAIALYQQEHPNPSLKLSDRLDEIDLEFLQDDFPKMLSSIQLGADRIRQIVLSLRNFSRLDEAEMKPVDIHVGIDSTLLILQYRLKAKPGSPGIQIVKQYGDLPEVECYASQLNQVFMNILSNAIDAIEEDQGISPDRPAPPTNRPSPTITIHTSLDESPEYDIPHAIIRITDTGPGIPLESQSRLFDPFFTTKPSGKGTGLGLSISYQIITERHGGTLQCTSEPGKGTEFKIEIPIQPTRVSSADPAHSTIG